MSAAKKDGVVPVGAALMPRGRPEEAGRGAPRGEGGQVQAARSPSQEGRGILDISRVPGVACPTVQDWQVRMHTVSLNMRLERGTRMPTGRILSKIKRRLGRDLSRYGYEAGSCQIVMIQDMPYKKFGMRNRAGTLGRALKRLGFSYRKPGPVPHSAAAPQEQERFKAETNRVVSETPDTGSRYPSAMNCTLASGPMQAAGGGRPTDATPSRPSTTPESRCQSLVCWDSIASASAPSIPTATRRSSGS